MGDMVKGNQAVAEAAMRQGRRSMPATPSHRPQRLWSICLTGWKIWENLYPGGERAVSINIVMGVAACGRRRADSIFRPGISLKQEGISYMAQYEFPCVILNVVRWGNGLGALDGAQTDYLRETRGGGNGDYRNIVLCPATVQESVDLMYEAFDLAEKYRNPVVVMTDSGLGQMMEPCEYPEFREITKCPWGLDGKFRTPRTDFWEGT